MYGGRDEQRIFSDLHRFNTETDDWEQLSSYIQEPKLRFGHTAVKVNDSMYIFGGWDGVATLNDLYEYNLLTGIWQERVTSGDIKGRYRHSAISNRTSMFVFGGID